MSQKERPDPKPWGAPHHRACVNRVLEELIDLELHLDHDSDEASAIGNAIAELRTLPGVEV